MTQTTSTDMIVPEVWADMTQAEFVGRVVLGADGGYGFAEVDSTLEGQPGDRVKTAKWAKIADGLDALAETDVIVPRKLDTTEGVGPIIKECGLGVEVTDKAILNGVGDPLGEAQRQFGVITARTIDADLRTAAVAGAGFTYDHGATTSTDVLDRGGLFSAGAVANALGFFGESADPADFAGFVIHSKARTDLFRQPEFISADKYGPNTTLLRGQIGDVYGVPIVVSDLTTKTGTGDATRYTNLLMKRGALALYYKRRPIVERDRDILARSTVITTNVHYAAGVKYADRIVKVITK